MSGDSSTLSNSLLAAVYEEPDVELCPRCHRKRLRWLRSMSHHSEMLWFKCDGCDHLLTRARETAGAAAHDAHA